MSAAPRADNASDVPASHYSAIVLGATGNVGGSIVRLLTDSPMCKRVIVITRRRTNAFAHPKVTEVVVDMEQLETAIAQHVHDVDIAFAAFGVGTGSAKLAELELRKIEVLYPAAFCRAAKSAGARVCALMTAAGADAGSKVKYLKIMGDKERAVQSLTYDFLGLYRPGMILGNSNTPRALGYVMQLVQWALPVRYHAVHKNDLARAMVAQSEQAFEEIARGKSVTDAVKVLEFSAMTPFFVTGDRDRA